MIITGGPIPIIEIYIDDQGERAKRSTDLVENHPIPASVKHTLCLLFLAALK
jgi:hypothetical protein